MIIKIIDNNNYIIKIFDENSMINDIYNKEEIKKLIKNIIKRLSKIKKINGTLIFNIYLDLYNNIIIKIYNIIKESKYLSIKINFHIDNIFLYKINFFDIEKLNIKTYSLYFYDNDFYLKINSKINNYKLSELGELVFDSKSRDIINNGILIT